MTLDVTDGTYASTGAGGVGVSLTASSSGTQSAFRMIAASLTPVVSSMIRCAITAVDTYGNATITGYSGSKTLTFGGLDTAPDGSAATVTSKTGVATALGSGTAFTFTSGTNSAGGTLVPHKSEGPVNLTVSDGSFTSAGSGGSVPALTVSPSVDTAYRITAASGTPAAGATDALTIKLVGQ